MIKLTLEMEAATILQVLLKILLVVLLFFIN